MLVRITNVMIRGKKLGLGHTSVIKKYAYVKQRFEDASVHICYLQGNLIFKRENHQNLCKRYQFADVTSPRSPDSWHKSETTSLKVRQLRQRQ